ncbi:HxlR family transcriptional regulator [Longimycelium tulufanense]|uniref:HxlR family transcriptional regulator n=1 Tax=Longimycelium tulufanense TaxID=907463 RepID=A0A8J3FWN1_9PSEU|nr:winged helix-turn-helix transcriptional regulator [Longimycelium tulufanense]GGM54473.1 HxlR family transcriptional regulator [Longimycelium tulufanense]
MADKRYYGQFCGLAAALDVVGERWTLLIVRELLLGPARFSEMMENLPGIGPNLLSERLRALTEQGVVTSAPVPGDGRGKQYRLTPLGEQLRGPVLNLARWGMGFLTEDTVGTSRATWGFLAVQAMIRQSEVPEVDETYEFVVGGEIFHIAVRDGVAHARRGHGTDPVLVIDTDTDTFIRVGAELLSPFEALATGKLAISGDHEAVQRCSRLLGLAERRTRPVG